MNLSLFFLLLFYNSFFTLISITFLGFEYLNTFASIINPVLCCLHLFFLQLYGVPPFFQIELRQDTLA